MIGIEIAPMESLESPYIAFQAHTIFGTRGARLTMPKSACEVQIKKKFDGLYKVLALGSNILKVNPTIS